MFPSQVKAGRKENEAGAEEQGPGSKLHRLAFSEKQGRKCFIKSADTKTQISALVLWPPPPSRPPPALGHVLSQNVTAVCAHGEKKVLKHRYTSPQSSFLGKRGGKDVGRSPTGESRQVCDVRSSDQPGVGKRSPNSRPQKSMQRWAGSGRCYDAGLPRQEGKQIRCVARERTESKRFHLCHKVEVLHIF